MLFLPALLFFGGCGDNVTNTIPPTPPANNERTVVIETARIDTGTLVYMDYQSNSHSRNFQTLRVEKRNGAKLKKATLCLQNDIDGDGYSGTTYFPVPGVEQVGYDEWIGAAARAVGGSVFSQLFAYDKDFVTREGASSLMEGGSVVVTIDLSAFDTRKEFFIEMSVQVPAAANMMPTRLSLNPRGMCGPEGVLFEGEYDEAVIRIHSPQLTIFKGGAKG